METQPLLMGIDIGSTSVKCAAVTPEGKVAAAASGKYPLSSPHPGWVEQNPKHWWRAVVKAVRECTAQIGSGRVCAVSFSGHMSALVLLDNKGEPVRPSMLVADTRCREQTGFLRERYMDVFKALTGNEPLEAFVAPRLLWLKQFEPESLEKAAVLVFPKDYVRYRFTRRLATEPTDAGNTLLFNPAAGDWEWSLIRELGLDPGLFPPICRSTETVGSVTREAARLTGLPEGIPVVAGGADMACSQLGTGATREGVMSVTLSTSAQIVVPLKAPIPSLAGAVTFHPSAVEGALYGMGTVYTGGLGVDWGLKLLSGGGSSGSAERARLERWTEEMKKYPPGSRGLLFLPFLVGSGTPYFDARDRASWLGLSIGQDKPLLLHSVMEGISYNIRENMEMFEKAGVPVRELRLGGGGSRNPVWCRMVGNVAGKAVSMLENRDASALGAAMLAGIGAKCYSSPDEAVDRAVAWKSRLEPDESVHAVYDGIYDGYRDIYRSINRYYRERMK